MFLLSVFIIVFLFMIYFYGGFGMIFNVFCSVNKIFNIMTIILSMNIFQKTHWIIIKSQICVQLS